jgi:hypothetical protein
MIRVLLFALMATTAFTSCRFVEGRRVNGDGNLSKEQRSLQGFNRVETHGSIDIILTPGDYKVTVESDKNIIPYIITEIVNNTLIVRFQDGHFGFNYTSATVYISAPVLHGFETHGSGNITANGKFTGSDKTEIVVGGSGDIKLDLNSPVVTTEISGSGNITLAGETKEFTSEINGSGDIRAYDLKAETVSSTVHGSGNTEVSASVKLDAEIFGSGDVNYRGTPQVSTSVHGSGAVNHEN